MTIKPTLYYFAYSDILDCTLKVAMQEVTGQKIADQDIKWILTIDLVATRGSTTAVRDLDTVTIAANSLPNTDMGIIRSIEESYIALIMENEAEGSDHAVYN